MPKGAECPFCHSLTFHDEGSYRRCSNCEYVGWSWQQSVSAVGSGKGNICPNCSNSTLHHILTLQGGIKIRRCSICDFSGIEPAAEEKS